MKSKPVFEKFEDFLDFLQNSVNEGVKVADLSNLQTLLGGYGMDATGKKAIANIESLAAQAGTSIAAADLAKISEAISKLAITDVTTIESVDVAVDEIEYTNLRGGAVETAKGQRVGLAEYLTKANKENLNGGYGKVPGVDEKKGRFVYDEKGGFLRGDGLIGQYIPVESSGILDMKEYKWDDPVKNPIISWPAGWNEAPKTKKGNSSPDQNPKNVQLTYVLYYVRTISNAGESYTSKEVETFVRPKSVETEKLAPIVIQEDLPLFKVNTAELTEDGKKAIMNALANVTTAESISVTGGASQEGSEERNKELCELRAKAVSEFLKTYFPTADIKPSGKADIQPKSPDTDEKVRKTWRKITLDVNGTSLVKTQTAGEETVTVVNNVNKKAQKAYIKAVTIGINGKYIG